MIFVNFFKFLIMHNLQNNSNILNFWVESSIPGAFLIGSDLIAEYCLTHNELEQHLLSENKIGCFYDDSDHGTGDITVTLEDFLQDIDPQELNENIDDYMKKHIMPKSGIEFEKLLQEYKHPDMWSFAPMPTADKYAEIEGQQRNPDTGDRKEEKRLLNNI